MRGMGAAPLCQNLVPSAAPRHQPPLPYSNEPLQKLLQESHNAQDSTDQGSAAGSFFQGTQTSAGAAGEVCAASRQASHGVGMLLGAQTVPEAKRYLWHNK